MPPLLGREQQRAGTVQDLGDRVAGQALGGVVVRDDSAALVDRDERFVDGVEEPLIVDR